MHISPAVVSDFLGVAALDRVAWQDQAESSFIPDGEHSWRIWCEHSVVVVAKTQEGHIVGAVLAFPCLDGSFCLHKVMVDRSHRGCGLGGKLFAALFQILDQRNVDCFLTVDPKNSNAVRLYRKWGFLEERFVAGYYRPTEDRLVLTRKFGTTL